MPKDRRGIETTAASAEAVAHYDDVIDAYLALGRDTGAHLKATFAADPDMPMAYCLKGYFYLLFALPALQTKAAPIIAAAQAAAGRGATDRERTHVEALARWHGGDWRAALDHWERILLEHPHDVLALRLAHYAHFYLGRADALRDSVARILPAWNESDPGFGYVLGMDAFGREEAGDFGPAEESGRRAVALNRDDPWAIHAVAHVMEMQGRHREGIAWICGLEDAWTRANNFAGHLWWHRALYHLELGEHDAVLELYDRGIRGEQSDEYLDICNGVSMLWRLENLGVDVGGRWEELSARCETRIEDGLLAFADLHYLIALAAGGRTDAVDRMLHALRVRTARQAGTQDEVIARVGLTACEAVAAFYRGDYQAAVDRLLPARYRLWQVGGSIAQRDLFALLLIAAAIRGGDNRRARALLAERTTAKPFSPTGWAMYAGVLQDLDDTAGAALARQRSSAARAA
jgi:tetratricopeptide (TPR) repeat protein